MATAGLDREVLVPLARAALENWARSGPAALTGPVARGDTGTVARHRAAVAERTPELLELFDALVGATERLAAADSTPGNRIRVRRARRPPGRRIRQRRYRVRCAGLDPMRNAADDSGADHAMMTVRTVRELRAALRPYRATARSAWCRPWARCTTATWSWPAGPRRRTTPW